jgi:hypothetical protein
MASYAPRPDGLLEVTLDDGRRVPTALDAATLESQGFYAMPMTEAPERITMQQGTAGLGNMGTPAQAPGLSDLGASPAFGQLMGAGAPQSPPPMGPPAPPPPPAQNMSVMPPPGMTPATPPPRPAGSIDPSRLAPAGGMAPAEAPAGKSDVDVATQAFLAGEFAPRGGSPVRRTPAHDERAAFNIKYRDVTEDPQLTEDIGESRIDQQLATQEGAEQSEYAKSVQAKLAARNASEAQQELERALVRKKSIEQDVGARLQAIDARIAKARAVTESGSARERVMKDKGWFGRILATIGVAMGAFAAGQTGGRNLVQEQLNQEVNEEMEREKQLYNVDPERSALKDLVEAWGTPQGAQKEYELHLREATLAKMEAWARQADAQSVPIEFRQWLADQALGVQQAKAKLHEDAAAEVTEQWRRVPEKVTGGGPAPRDPLKVMQRTAQFREAYEKATGQNLSNLKPREQEAIFSRSLRLPNGEVAFAPDQKRAQETEAQLNAVSIIRQNIGEIRTIMKKPASEVNLADRERLRVLVQSNTTVGKEAEKLGALSGPDMGLIAPLSGEQALRRLNPMNPDVAILAGLEAAEKHFDRKSTAAMRGVYRDPQMRQPFSGARPSSFKGRE